MAKTRTPRPPKRAPLDFVDRIQAKLDDLTPTQRILAEFIIHRPESLLGMSISELAEEAQVSQATVVRFCTALGFDGFSQFSKEARHIIQSQIDTVGRFNLGRMSNPVLESEAPDQWRNSAFIRILKHELDNLTRLGETIKVDDFREAVRSLAEADRVLIIGCLSSTSLALHFGAMLSKVFPQVEVLTGETNLAVTNIQALTDRSVVILIAFPRYPKVTLRLGRAAARTEARIISITNSHISPISGLGRITFHIQVGIPSFLDAYAAPITFINALVAEVGEAQPERTAAALAAWDRRVLKMDLLYQQTRRGRPRKTTQS